MSKIISVNPNLFNFSGVASRRTRKSSTSGGAPKIRVKAPKPPASTKTVKRSILKFIRNHQDQNYRRLMTPGSGSGGGVGAGGGAALDSPVSHPDPTPVEKSEFEASLEYLSGLAKETAEAPVVHGNVYAPIAGGASNRTLKHRAPISGPPPPQFGCLKKGALPTYREYMRTLRAHPQPVAPSHLVSPAPPPPPSVIGGGVLQPPATLAPLTPLTPLTSLVGPPKPAFSFADFATDARADKANELLQFKQKLKTPVGGGGRKPMPKRKTVRRRTFRVGKSKVHSRVSVLVSNKTIRSRIATDTQLLKQTPMPEVKRYLRKHGLIKVGGSTPPDVLRQMYESAKTMCGEVVNHSPENMLYNFLNDE